MKKLFTIILCLAITLVSCDKDDSSSGNPEPQQHDPNTFSENFGSEIQRNFLGKVIDTDRNPIEGVTITIGTKTAMTDANGIFIINDATVNEHFGYVKASKPGYLHGSRSVVPSSGTNNVTIMLLPETVAGTTNSGTAETITLPNGASVALEGDYQKADGSAYSGSVNVMMHHLDPASEDMQDQMPGMLYAANAQNQPRMLQTFGMLAVELRGSGGEELNLAEGSSAEIKVPLDASLIADAPSTIPLWHFDEQYGYWIEDGVATLVGNAYVGTVTHFSFWFLCTPTSPISLCIEVTDENNNPLNFIGVELAIFGESHRRLTNELGLVCGMAPSNRMFQLRVFNQACLNIPIYTVDIGPFTTSTTYTIVIPSTVDATTETILGSFKDCNGNNVTEGYVQLNYNNNVLFEYVDNGSFEFNVLHCSTGSNTFTIEGQDFQNIQSTGTINYTFTSPSTNIGNLLACNSIEEFITYQVDDHPPITYNFFINSGFDADIFIVQKDDPSGNNHTFNMGISQFNGVGVYNVQNYYTWIAFTDENADFGDITTDDISIYVTEYGQLDEYVDMNFSGTYVDGNSISHTITGVLHIIRDN
ncbi:carboxypeptidase-like regulatory domain-containing protein [Subsaxibacter sp. CAU 1640]|uniref:carboxypeptidase-like regulatory domain-containing protein n=1 Tax=Subsaxibacter sp. CAU 1640 TaxID=2933271 RepID=UPI002004732F|nr:carboxypeptidase-like regulatory domain-containing protein [Subsaxibacter sp. CAU 1640]MCK7590341.1 carboxypeptidase-like regulatory domain-containing protein [Subsaxibacter sp. CAU 1640]